MNKRLYEVLRAPLVSEKATRVGEQENSVVFWVKADANKAEIKQAVQAMFKVEVKVVRTCNFPARNIRVGGRQGRSRNRKKAYVTLMPGQQITFGDES